MKDINYFIRLGGVWLQYAEYIRPYADVIAKVGSTCRNFYTVAIRPDGKYGFWKVVDSIFVEEEVRE